MTRAEEPALRSVCVFCGSSGGTRPVYVEAAAALGRELAGRGLRTVYGGGNVGLMGVLADAALEAGGHVAGFIPHALVEREVVHDALTELHVVDSMHERKALMAELSDAFVALPGGLGTLEELFEVLTWAQLGFHHHPVALLDVAGFFEPLLAMLTHCREEGFVRPEHGGLWLVERDPARLIGRLASHRAPEVPRWIGPDET